MQQPFAQPQAQQGPIGDQNQYQNSPQQHMQGIYQPQPTYPPNPQSPLGQLLQNPPMQQQQQPQQTFQPMQPFPPMQQTPLPLPQQQPPQITDPDLITAAPPLQQVQQPQPEVADGGPSESAIPDDGDNAVILAEEEGKKKLLWSDRNLWLGGRSVVGRKGKDGEWMEVTWGCVAM